MSTENLILWEPVIELQDNGSIKVKILVPNDTYSAAPVSDHLATKPDGTTTSGELDYSIPLLSDGDPDDNTEQVVIQTATRIVADTNGEYCNVYTFLEQDPPPRAKKGEKKSTMQTSIQSN